MDKELKIVISADDRATPTISKLENKLKGTSKEFDNTTISTQGFGSAITKANIIAGLAVEGLIKLASSIFDVGKMAIDTASQFEQARVGFDVMLGSAEEGAKIMKDISKFARTSPFELTDLVEYTKRLTAFGVESKDIIKTMEVLGDVSSIVGREKLPQIVRAYGQAKVAGRLMLEEVNQLNDAGVATIDILVDYFNKQGGIMTKIGGPTKQLARESASLNKKLDDQKFKLEFMAKNGDKGEKAYKKLEEQIKFTKAQIKDLGPISEASMGRVKVNASQMREMISDGAVSFEDFRKAMTMATEEGGPFFGAREKQAKTLSGTLSNLKDTATRTMLAIVGMEESGDIREGSLFARIKEGGEQLMIFLDQSTPAIVNQFALIGDAIIKVSNYLATKFAPLIEKAGPLLEKFGGFLLRIAEQVLPILATAFDFILTEVLRIIEYFVDQGTIFWNTYGNDIEYVMTNILRFIKFVVDGIVWIWQNDFAYIRTIISWTLQSIVNVFKAFSAGIMQLLKMLIGLFTLDWKKFTEGLVGMLGSALTLINNLFNRVPSIIWDNLKKGWEFMTEWLGKMWEGVKKWADNTRKAISDALNWEKKKSPSYKDYMSETKRGVDDGFSSMNRSILQNAPFQSVPSTSNVNINFNGNMSVRSDNDITAIAQEIKRMINREDVLFAKGLY